MNIKRIIFVSACVIFFAGCSLTGGGNDGGIFRSDDGGKTFSQKVAAPQNKNIGTVDALSMATDPQNGSVVYLGTKSSGIFKSENGGDLWNQLKAAATTPEKVYAIAVDPQNSQNIFAAAVIDSRGKIMKSEDAGTSWKEIYSEATNAGLVLALGINPQNPEKLFAGTDKGQIIFSEDAGQSWRSLFWTKSSKAVYKIALDSANPDLAYFLLFESGVLRTSDGGQTFEELSRNANDNALTISSGFDKAISISTDPLRGDTVYLGDSEGLLRSRDRGESWEVLKTLNNSQNATVRSIAINPQNSDEIIFSAAQAFYKSNDGGVNWMPIEFNTARSPEVVTYNPQNPQQIFVGMNSR